MAYTNQLVAERNARAMSEIMLKVISVVKRDHVFKLEDGRKITARAVFINGRKVL